MSLDNEFEKNRSVGPTVLQNQTQPTFVYQYNSFLGK